jgi:2-methylisocitrate lyase-like PEP mutase family enzyme
MAITKSLVWPRSVSGLTVAPEGVERVSPRQRPDHPFAGAMETTMNKSNDVEPTRELTEAEVDAVSGGWFAFHATAEAIDAVAKALATMAQKQ